MTHIRLRPKRRRMYPSPLWAFPLRDIAKLYPYPSKGFYSSVDGIPFHVLGDPNMSDKTLEALQHVVRAAYEAIERGDFDKDDEKNG